MSRAHTAAARAPAAPPTVDPLDALLAPLAARLAPLLVAMMESHLRASAPAELAPLATKQQAAAALAVSTASIDRGCREGWLPFLLVGDVRRFDLVAVRAALEARTAAQRATGEHTVDRDEAPESRPSGVRRLGRAVG